VKVIEHIVEHSLVDLQQSHEQKVESSCHNNQQKFSAISFFLVADETRQHTIESHVSSFKFDETLQQSCFSFSTQDTYDNGHFSCHLFLDEDPNSNLVCIEIPKSPHSSIELESNEQHVCFPELNDQPVLQILNQQGKLNSQMPYASSDERQILDPFNHSYSQ
jgi:hypothetical protein